MISRAMIVAFLAIAMCELVFVTANGQQGDPKVPAALNFKMTSLDGKEVDLAKYQGKVVLIVNVASKCGYTPQYKPLQELYAKHANDGLVIVGVPCNQFGKQEAGSNEQIAEFCEANYGVTFPMLAKVDVNGVNACPLYKHLTGKDTNPDFAGPIKWNFEKFLIGRDGKVAARFVSNVDPTGPAFTSAIQEALKK